jgi:hypothetical protein
LSATHAGDGQDRPPKRSIIARRERSPLKPDTILELTPTLVKAVQAKGGAEVAGLLAGALK